MFPLDDVTMIKCFHGVGHVIWKVISNGFPVNTQRECEIVSGNELNPQPLWTAYTKIIKFAVLIWRFSTSFSKVKWASWLFKWPATHLFVQNHVHTDNKGNIMSLYSYLFQPKGDRTVIWQAPNHDVLTKVATVHRWPTNVFLCLLQCSRTIGTICHFPTESGRWQSLQLCQ